MSARSGVSRRRWLRAGIAVGLLAVLGVVGVTAAYLMQPTTLTVAVAPRDGTEPGLMDAFAAALVEGHRNIRLKVASYDDVRARARPPSRTGGPTSRS